MVKSQIVKSDASQKNKTGYNISAQHVSIHQSPEQLYQIIKEQQLTIKKLTAIVNKLI